MKVQFDGHCYLRYHKEANISLIDVDDKDGLLKSLNESWNMNIKF